MRIPFISPSRRRRSAPPSQGWKTFLHNHADGIAAMDLFVVPTISFRLGTADDKFCGLASQLTPLQNGSQIRSRKHAVGNRLPRYLIRDRDGAYGEVFIRRLR